jgi:hypothetical protein
VGIKEEINDINTAGNTTQLLNKDIGIIHAGGSQWRYHSVAREKKDTFLAGVGSLFPQRDIKMDIRAEDKCFKVFFKYGWHPSLRYALQYLKLIPEYNRQPWPELSKQAKTEIENVTDEIKEMV